MQRKRERLRLVGERRERASALGGTRSRPTCRADAVLWERRVREWGETDVVGRFRRRRRRLAYWRVERWCAIRRFGWVGNVGRKRDPYFCRFGPRGGVSPFFTLTAFLMIISTPKNFSSTWMAVSTCPDTARAVFAPRSVVLETETFGQFPTSIALDIYVCGHHRPTATGTGSPFTSDSVALSEQIETNRT